MSEVGHVGDGVWRGGGPGSGSGTVWENDGGSRLKDQCVADQIELRAAPDLRGEARLGKHPVDVFRAERAEPWNCANAPAP